MDRQIVYIGQIIEDTDELLTNRNVYIGLSKLAAALLGTTTILNGFTCVPTSPASLSVNVTAGEMYFLQAIDSSAYGSLSPDAYTILKQGIILSTTVCSCPAPITIGYSINYLIEIAFNEVDNGSTVLAYYNAANPAQPLNGPGNTGTAQNTIRQDTVTLTVKAGTAAPTGTQLTPSPDAGNTGAFVITVAYGQTTINSGAISIYNTANFINETLIQKISQATADARYAQITQVQSGQFTYGVDTGTANNLVVALSPAITSYSAGNAFNIIVANTTTTASTININSVGAANIKRADGSATGAGDLISGEIVTLVYDGANFRIMGGIYAQITQVQAGQFIYGVDTGSANTYVVTLSPVLTSYSAGNAFNIKISNSSTGASTININSLGAISIKRAGGLAVGAGDLVAGEIVSLIYDGTYFYISGGIYAQIPQVQSGQFVYAIDSGIANTYVAALTPALTSYTAGNAFNIKIANTSTGASTLNINSLGAKSIKRANGSALGAGDLNAGEIVTFVYDGTNFYISSGAQISQVQSGQFIYAVDSGTANTYVAALSPALAAYSAGNAFNIKIAHSSTGASTININSLGAKSIKRPDGSALGVGDLLAGEIATLVYDGTNFYITGALYAQITQVQSGQFIYGIDTGSVNTITANLTPALTSYVQGNIFNILVANTNTGATTINLNSLGSQNVYRANGAALGPGDIVAGQTISLAYDGSNFFITGGLAGSIRTVKNQTISVSGPYTPSTGMQFCKILALGGGGGGGGAAGGTSTGAAGGGGGAGCLVEGIYTAAQIGASQSITIGTAGGGGSSGNHAGSNGGATTVGALISAGGGSGGLGSAAISSPQIEDGGAGGSGTGGYIQNVGQGGSQGLVLAAGIAVGGNGGSTLWGSGGFGFGTVGSTQFNGDNGHNYGCGGGGASSGSVTSASGGNGTAGIVVITEWCST